MKDVKLLISSSLIILSFFAGYAFSERKIISENKKITETKQYVNIETLKTKIKVHNSDPNIIILVNGEEKNSSEIELKK